MATPDAAWQSLFETHLASLRTHRAMLEHMAALVSHDPEAAAEIDAMRSRADTIWEDANRAGELLRRVRASSVASSVYEETPGRPRRISSGPIANDTPSPTEERLRPHQSIIPEPSPSKKRVVEYTEYDTSRFSEHQNGPAEIKAGVIVANMPEDFSTDDVRTLFKIGKSPLIVGPQKRPRPSDIKQYDLPKESHERSIIFIGLPNEAEAARAMGFDGSVVRGHRLIVRAYKPPPSNKSGQKRRGSGTFVTSPTEPSRKRQRTGEAQTSIFTSSLTSPTEPTRAPEAANTVEYEDISAEVEARLAEQAAKRAAARTLGKAGDKRHRSLDGSSPTEEAIDDTRRMSVESVEMAEMRPNKRARGSTENARKTEWARPAASGRGSRRDRRKRFLRQDNPPLGMTNEQEEVDDSPRPQKRRRADDGVDNTAWDDDEAWVE